MHDKFITNMIAGICWSFLNNIFTRSMMLQCDNVQQKYSDWSLIHDQRNFPCHWSIPFWFVRHFTTSKTVTGYKKRAKTCLILKSSADWKCITFKFRQRNRRGLPRFYKIIISGFNPFSNWHLKFHPESLINLYAVNLCQQNTATHTAVVKSVLLHTCDFHSAREYRAWYLYSRKEILLHNIYVYIKHNIVCRDFIVWILFWKPMRTVQFCILTSCTPRGPIKS